MKRVDLKIGFYCNNKCEFCVQGNKRKLVQAKDIGLLEKNLKDSFAKGFRGVVFTGGEPTMHLKFLEIVALAKKIGYEVIQIQTNGRMFAYRDFCIKTIQAGANEFSPAVHGPNAKIHDELTRAKGSFDQTAAGIKNLKSLGQRVLINSVITSKNYRYLPDTARLLVGLDVDQFQFAYIHIAGTAAENSDWIAPKKSVILPYLHKALKIGLDAGKKAYTEAIPYCLMEGFEQCISERIIPDSSVYDIDYYIEDYGNYRKNSGKAKGPNCIKCKYDKVCEGPWKEYPGIYGWNEFKPVK